MSVLNWLKTVTKRGASADVIAANPVKFGEGEEEFYGLDMRAALDAHIAWTRRLQAQLEGEDTEALEVSTVAADDNCTLGKWIYGAARARFGKIDEYNDLRRVHADFHLKAGEILNKAQNGESGAARDDLKAIRRKSGEVQLALVRLYSASLD